MARGYRFSSTYIEKNERSLVGVLLVGIGVPWAVAGVMLWVGQLLWAEPPTAYAVILGALVVAPIVTVVVAVTVAAILGGRSLSRSGWAMGLAFSLWFFVGLALVLGGVLSWPVYAAGWAVLVGGFFLLGWRRGVPMWLGGTRAVPVIRRFRRPERADEAARIPEVTTEQIDHLGRPVAWRSWADDVAAQVLAGADVGLLARSATPTPGATRQERADRYAAVGTVPYLVWRRLVRGLHQEHQQDFPRGSAHYLTPLYLRSGRSASGATEAKQLCRMSHRAMHRTDREHDDGVNLDHHRRDTFAARLARRGRPEPERLVTACLTEAAALIRQRDVVLEVAQEARR